jgi:hypothetical protein
MAGLEIRSFVPMRSIDNIHYSIAVQVANGDALRVIGASQLLPRELDHLERLRKGRAAHHP